MNISWSSKLSHCLAWLTGLASVLCFAPFNFPWLWLFIIPALLKAIDLTVRRITTLFWFYQGMWLAGASWIYYSIHTFGGIPLWLTLLGVVAFCTFMALISTIPFLIWSGRKPGPLSAFILLEFCAIWVLGEWTREWILTGFPWLQLAHGWIDTPITGFATIGGTLLVSAVIIGMTVSLYQVALKMTTGRTVIWFATWSSIWLIGWQLSLVPWTKPQESSTRIAIVQPNLEQSIKWDPSELDNIVGQLTELTDTTNAELVFWPEAAIPSIMRDGSPFLDSLDRYASSRNATIITGVPTVNFTQDGYDIFNSIIATNQGGRYHKQRLVPFGEYIPLIDLVGPILQLLDLPVGSQAQGTGQQQPLTAGHIKIAPAVCYEVAYGSVVASLASKANVLSNHSNDSWFGDTRGPDQHFQIARWRSVEASKPLIRVTNNGISAVVNHRGEIMQILERNVTTLGEATVTPRDGRSPFHIWGNSPLLVLLITILLMAKLRRFINKSS